MRSTPKPVAKKTSPLVWVGLVGALAGVYLWSSSGETPPAAATKKSSKSTSRSGSTGPVTEADYKANFAPVRLASVDAFKPLVTKPAVSETVKGQDLKNKGMPLSLTGGEANWYFSGIAELNGQRQGLLENTTSGETVYVSPGDTFKAARVAAVDISAVVMIGPDGSRVTVPIVELGAAPGQAAPTTVIAQAPAGNQPLNLPRGALSGPIGVGPNGLAVQPLGQPGANGQTMADPNAAGNSSYNTGRRGRRNRRNQNQYSNPNFGGN